MVEAMDKIAHYLEVDKPKSVQLWETKLANYQELEPSKVEFDLFEGEIEAFGFAMNGLPKVKMGTVTNIYTKLDKRGNEMAWVTFDTKYGKVRTTVFSSMWKKQKKNLVPNSEWWFYDKDGILKELKAC